MADGQGPAPAPLLERRISAGSSTAAPSSPTNFALLQEASLPGSLLLIGMGAVNRDLLATAPGACPRNNWTARGKFTSSDGGKAANELVAAKRIAGDLVHAAVVGVVGGDGEGKIARDGLARNGVDTRHLRVQTHDAAGSPVFTGVSVQIANEGVLSDPSNPNSPMAGARKQNVSCAESNNLHGHIEVRAVGSLVEEARRSGRRPLLLIQLEVGVREPSE